MRKEIQYYLEIKMRKMGQWALAPSDSETWHGEDSSKYFKKLYGVSKGSLALHNFKDHSQHMYFPQEFFDNLYACIKKINKKDYKGLERKLKTFYPLKKKAKQAIQKINPKDLSKISNIQLIKIYKKNRDWMHRMTIYDQFGWTAEGYWIPIMEDILVKKLKIQRNSKEYYNVLFKLTKPEEISTTLKEKRAVLSEVIKIKEKNQSIDIASKKLAKQYGWMPVFTYGTPWGPEYYQKQIGDLLSQNLLKLKQGYHVLKNYSEIRNRDVSELVGKYHIQKKDLQIFIDFGLALDTRNEEEYLVSFAGFHLLPIYKEISRRTYLAINQIRNLFEDEIIETLKGAIDPIQVLKDKGNICGWGFNRAMTKRINFTKNEASRIFRHLEKTAENLQGNDENQGVCANIGMVKGKAKIILNPTQNDKVKNGDIMIAQATTVDYLPAMKRAAAFVTEVGGLTCHAAVVAREFGVPAIVSYKNATKVFQDGDMIEVDAGNGIIKKV
ncbi:hypothetical protein KKB10_05230 [Patescibacteria group bacterium]|nr:hypothetical protein [Patescibacteria group bacterium]MBU1952304.1 hypothetical protein [Patescibacteria group bacterium]